MAEDIISNDTMPTSETLMEKYGNLGLLIGNSHPAIQQVILFGSQRKGTNGPESDIDIAALIDSATPQLFRGQLFIIKQHIRRALDLENHKIGKGAGNVDLEILRSVILTTSPEKLGTLAKFVVEGVTVFKRK